MQQVTACFAWQTSFGSIWLHFWDSWSCRLRSWGSRQLGITGAAESKSMDIMEPCWTVNHGKSISVTQTMVFTCFYIAGQWLPLLLASDCGFGRSASGHRGENVTKSPQLQSHRLSKAEIQFTTDFEEREIDKLCPKLYVTLCHIMSLRFCIWMYPLDLVTTGASRAWWGDMGGHCFAISSMHIHEADMPMETQQLATAALVSWAAIRMKARADRCRR
jgi:hypothetical protein